MGVKPLPYSNTVNLNILHKSVQAPSVQSHYCHTADGDSSMKLCQKKMSQ